MSSYLVIINNYNQIIKSLQIGRNLLYIITNVFVIINI